MQVLLALSQEPILRFQFDTNTQKYVGSTCFFGVVSTGITTLPSAGRVESRRDDARDSERAQCGYSRAQGPFV